MRPQPILIHLNRQQDADCVRQALAAQPAVDGAVDRLDVLVDMRSRSLGDVLSVLHACLVENEIALARIKIDDRTYVMEPAYA